MTSLLFGKRCPSQSDSTIQQFIEYIELWNAILDPTAHPPVDLLPILKWIPERWAPWKRMCRKAKSLREEMILPLMQDCQERLDAGKSTDSWMEKVLQNQQGINMDKNMILCVITSVPDSHAHHPPLTCFSLSLVSWPRRLWTREARPPQPIFAP